MPGSAVHLTLNDRKECSVRPVRRIPESVKELRALEVLEGAGKRVPVEEPSDWVNQMPLSIKKS